MNSVRKALHENRWEGQYFNHATSERAKSQTFIICGQFPFRTIWRRKAQKNNDLRMLIFKNLIQQDTDC